MWYMECHARGIVQLLKTPYLCTQKLIKIKKLKIKH